MLPDKYNFCNIGNTVILILESLTVNYGRNQSHTPKRLTLKLENSVSLAMPEIGSQRTF